MSRAAAGELAQETYRGAAACDGAAEPGGASRPGFW